MEKESSSDASDKREKCIFLRKGRLVGGSDQGDFDALAQKSRDFG